VPNGLPAYLRSLTYGGVDLQRSDLSLHLDISEGLNDGLRVRGKDTVVPSLAGNMPRNRVADVRDIRLTGWAQGGGATEVERLAAWQALRDELEELFTTVGEAVDRIQTLEGIALDGSTRSIDCATEVVLWTPSEAFAAGVIAVQLVATTPTWATAS
jgi:hypothetical protein